MTATVDSKACTKCGATKPISAFSISLGRKFDRSSHCKTCIAAYHKNYLAKHRINRVAPTEKLCPRCQSTKPASDFFPNAVRKDQLSVYCQLCQREYMKVKQYDKKRYAEFPKEESERNRKYRLENAEVLKVKGRINSAIKRERDPGLVRAQNIARKYSQKRATPPWADMSAINLFYKEAKRLEMLDGVKRNVDHIFPIHSPLVCGLHVENNLQILTASENMSKHNKFEAQ